MEIYTRLVSKRFFSSLVILLIGFIVSVFTMFPHRLSAQELCTEEALRNSQVSMVNCTGANQCTQTGPTGSGSLTTGNKVYILGDSITVRSEQAYRQKLSAKGVTPIVNASVSRSWEAKGQGTPSSEGTTQAGIDAVNSDAAKIQSVNGIVIALGTNGGLGGNPISEVIDAIRAKNANAPIWWVNTVGSPSWPSDITNLGPFNKSLAEQATVKNYRVIDWFKVVNPGGDSTVTPTQDASGLLEDGIHPNQKGIDQLTNTVVSQIAGGGTSTPTSNTGSNCQCSVSEGAVNLVGNDNLEKIYRFFLGKGLSPEQSAGIAGNAMAESGGNPLAASRSGYRGIFQWDRNNRWPRLVQYAQEKGQNPESLEAQLAFSYDEANQRKNIEGIKQYSQVDLAAWYWGRFYEVAIIGGSTSTTPLTNVQALQKRINYGQEILQNYGGIAPGASSSSSGQNCSVSSGSTQYIDNFVIYNQYDPAWKDKPYGSSTIGVSGCGPSAMAMVIATLTDQKITPVEAANYAASQGLYVAGAGSSWSISPKLAANWGLKSEPIRNDLATITAALQSGKVVVTPGAGAKPFTSGGHFIVIRGITAEGKFKVADSGHSDTSDKDWDPQPIINNMRSGGAYAIFK